MNILRINHKQILERLKKSKLFKDSFWAVFGNGMGNAMLLVAGILIARLLGKDLYGEYGVVKTTMFHIAAFSTFGLGYTSTKFIAQYIKENPTYLRAITKAALKITLLSSGLLCILLLVFANQLAEYVNDPHLATPFRFLGVIVITRALSTVCSGTISGYKKFKEQGINNIISGTAMLVLAPTLTYLWGLNGSLVALLSSQLILTLLNFKILWNIFRILPDSDNISFTRRLFVFSIPVAMQEFTYALSHWGGTLILAKYASIGEVGIYSASGQWNTIIRYIPALLSSVVLSYLSSSITNKEHNSMMFRMIIINLACISVPFIIVLVCSGWITSMYGPTFNGMQSVLIVLIFCTVISVVARVFQNELISRGRNWLMFSLRSGKDLLTIGGLFVILKYYAPHSPALSYAIVDVVANIFFLTALVLSYMLSQKRESINS